MISSRTLNNIRLPNHITHITLYRQRTLSVRTLRVRELCRHDRTPLLSITNSGTWMPILAPTYSMKIFIDRTVMTTYVIPFVYRYVTCRDSIVGILIPSSISLLASLFTRFVILHPATNSLVTLLARILMMCIIKRAQRYLSNNRSDKS